ncbi:MAG: hypothetical protein CTY29_11575 [Methylobacter sp.]|nr:MAG: hypothetical protein CTY29_11575 [Methylobacter sp.]
MTTKDEYIENFAAELKGWSAQIDELNAKTEKSVGITKLKYHQELNALRALQTNADTKMKTMKAASGEAWDAARETADKVWDDLRSGLAVAVTKFK